MGEDAQEEYEEKLEEKRSDGAEHHGRNLEGIIVIYNR
jgi:hypothetical protein